MGDSMRRILPLQRLGVKPPNLTPLSQERGGEGDEVLSYGKGIGGYLLPKTNAGGSESAFYRIVRFFDLAYTDA